MRKIAATTAILAAMLTAGCDSSVRDVQTPAGAVHGTVAGPFVVLGVADRATSTLNRTNGSETFLETKTIDVPAGTEVIVPSVRGWDLGFGSSDPADLSTMPAANGTFRWNAADHHFGLAAVDVNVVDIDAVDPTTGRQTATIRVGARLNDDNGDDPWFGVVRYELMFLGRPQR